jgi:hypothetical protein
LTFAGVLEKELMMLTKHKVALKRLSAFRPVPSTRLGPDGRTGSELEGLIQRVAQFVKALAATSAKELLNDGDRQFLELTAPESAFDKARRDALNLLDSACNATVFVPDRRRAPITNPMFTLSNYLEVDVDLQAIYPNYTAEIRRRLSDLIYVRLNLPNVLEDARVLLEADSVILRVKKSFRKWHGLALQVERASTVSHLLGSHLLAECSRVYDPDNADLVSYESFHDHLSKDRARFLQIMQDAALYLRASVPGQLRRRRSASKWCHTPEEPRPAQYKVGPLKGTQTLLARAICGAIGKEMKPRALHRLGRVGDVWIVELGPQLFEVYFKDHESHGPAKSEYLRLTRHENVQ